MSGSGSTGISAKASLESASGGEQVGFHLAALGAGRNRLAKSSTGGVGGDFAVVANDAVPPVIVVKRVAME